MKRIIALGVLLTLTGSVAGAESREDMSRDLVKVRRGQYVFEDYSLCKLDARKLLAASTA
jgi:hypothetical protein